VEQYLCGCSSPRWLGPRSKLGHQVWFLCLVWQVPSSSIVRIFRKIVRSFFGSTDAGISLPRMQARTGSMANRPPPIDPSEETQFQGGRPGTWAKTRALLLWISVACWLQQWASNHRVERADWRCPGVPVSAHARFAIKAQAARSSKAEVVRGLETISRAPGGCALNHSWPHQRQLAATTLHRQSFASIPVLLCLSAPALTPGLALMM